MPRVNLVKAAAKDYPQAGIKRGESYYWWKFRYGSKHMSKTHPRPSQLTQSDFLSRQMELEERLGDLQADTFEDLKSQVEDIIMEIRQLGEEQEDKHGNLPEGLSDGPTGELLEGRASACEDWAGELEGVDLEIEEPTEDEARESVDEDEATEGVADEDRQAAIESAVEAALESLREEYEQKLAEAIDELQGCSYQGE